MIKIESYKTTFKIEFGEYITKFYFSYKELVQFKIKKHFVNYGYCRSNVDTNIDLEWLSLSEITHSVHSIKPNIKQNRLNRLNKLDGLDSDSDFHFIVKTKILKTHNGELIKTLLDNEISLKSCLVFDEKMNYRNIILR